jgi:hypothetical protein
MSEPELATIRTDIPARLDRLPWARWHWSAESAPSVAGSPWISAPRRRGQAAMATVTVVPWASVSMCTWWAIWRISQRPRPVNAFGSWGCSPA